MKAAKMGGKLFLAGLALAAFLGGCAVSPSSEDDFGNSVRRMIEAQKYIPPEQAALQPPPLEGAKAESAVDRYRKDVGKPDRIYQDTSYGPVQMNTQ